MEPAWVELLVLQPRESGSPRPSALSFVSLLVSLEEHFENYQHNVLNPTELENPVTV